MKTNKIVTEEEKKIAKEVISKYRRFEAEKMFYERTGKRVSHDTLRKYAR